MTELERLQAELDAAYLAAYAFDAEAARVAYSAARDASKAYNATLAAQGKETPNE